jgi:hypothetical protein
MTKKKTKKPKEIPDAYQFTSEDIDWYWDNFNKLGGLDAPKPEATEQELYFFNLVDQADRLSRFLKRMPTMGELRRWWHSERKSTNEGGWPVGNQTTVSTKKIWLSTKRCLPVKIQARS